MSDLRNQTPSTTYKGLLQVNDYSNGVDATSKFVQDGEGTNSALSISTTKVGVGTSSPLAPLDVTSTTGGVVFPRLTTAQRDLISSPTNGETIYNTTTTQVESWNGTDWVAGGTTVVANDAVTSNSIANDAVITSKIADNAVTPAKISSTDTLLNVNDTHQTIGLGILANASSSFPKVKMDGGVQVGDQASTLSLNSELAVTGNGNLTLMTVENTSTTSTDQSVVVVKGPIPTLQLNDTVAPTDQGVMNLNMTDGSLRFTLISDDTLTTTDLFKIEASGVTNLPLCPTFADNSAAVTGGLATNDVYKTSTGELRIVV